LANTARLANTSHSSADTPSHRPGQHIGGVDGVLTGHHHQRGVGIALTEGGQDHRRDELQHVGADGGGDDVRLRHRGDDVDLVRLAVQRAVVVDGFVVAAGADRVHRIARRRRQRVDEIVHDIGEDDLVAGPVQQQPDESAPDVAGAEMDGQTLTCHPVSPR